MNPGAVVTRCAAATGTHSKTNYKQKLGCGSKEFCLLCTVVDMAVICDVTHRIRWRLTQLFGARTCFRIRVERGRDAVYWPVSVGKRYGLLGLEQ